VAIIIFSATSTATFVKQCHLSRENTVLQFVLRQYGQALSNISPSSVPTENMKANIFLLKDRKDKKRKKRNKKTKGMKRKTTLNLNMIHNTTVA
jgi:hypothetical protein